MNTHDLLKYFKRNPGKEFPELAEFVHAVVIPAYDENETLPYLLENLSTIPTSVPIAVIVVVNYPVGAGERSSIELYEKLLNTDLSGDVGLFPVFSPALTNGVGEARKIGFDIFCRSRNAENADTSVIFSLDADCLVHNDYFTETLELLSSANYGCAAIRVAHRMPEDKELAKAVEVYEKYLFDYEENLARCHSPYAYNAIGSGFAVKVRDYIRCGGMKLKKAGEEFYFMQSIAKCSEIVKTSKALVYPSGRISERVPFGTGTAVRDIMVGVMPRQVTAEAFEELKKVMETLNTPGVLDRGENFICLLSAASADFFLKNGFIQTWERIMSNQKPVSDQDKQNAFHLWFDALQTRRFLHQISES